MKLHAVEAELLRADRRRDGQRDDEIKNRVLLFCERVIIKAKNALCADYCHQPVNSSTLRHISLNHVQQNFFKCRPSA
jgi:hypothetical protein